jgi:hypothetical protein
MTGDEDIIDLKVLFTAIKNLFNDNVPKVSPSYDTNLTVLCFVVLTKDT